MDTSEILVLVIAGIVAIYIARRSPQDAASILVELLKREKRNDIKRNDENDPRD